MRQLLSFQRTRSPLRLKFQSRPSMFNSRRRRRSCLPFFPAWRQGEIASVVVPSLTRPLPQWRLMRGSPAPCLILRPEPDGPQAPGSHEPAGRLRARVGRSAAGPARPRGRDRLVFRAVRNSARTTSTPAVPNRRRRTSTACSRHRTARRDSCSSTRSLPNCRRFRSR
jgi:hypothetical protein